MNVVENPANGQNGMHHENKMTNENGQTIAATTINNNDNNNNNNNTINNELGSNMVRKREEVETKVEQAKATAAEPPKKVPKLSFLDKLKSKMKETKEILSTTTPTPTITPQQRSPFNTTTTPVTDTAAHRTSRTTTKTMKSEPYHNGSVVQPPKARVTPVPAPMTATTTSHIPRTGDKPIPLSVAYDILNKVKKHHWAWPFAKPVNAKALNIPDYYDIVKHPMDISSVTNKLNKNKYGHIDEFMHDMSLIWSNCYLYNAPNSDIVVMCRKIQQYFEKEAKKQFVKYQKRTVKTSAFVDDGYFYDEKPLKKSSRKKKKLSKRSKKSSSVASTSAIATAASNAAAAYEQQKKTSSKRSRGGTSKSSRSRGGSKKSSSHHAGVNSSGFPAMSFAQKKQLTEDIRGLEVSYLAEVVKIFQEDAAVNTRDDDGGTMEVDVASLSDAALYKLEQYVKSVKEKKYAYVLPDDSDFSSDSSDSDDDKGFTYLPLTKYSQKVVTTMDTSKYTEKHPQTRLVCGPEKRSLSSPSIIGMTPTKQWPIQTSNQGQLVAKTPTMTAPDEIWHMLQTSASSEERRKHQLQDKIEGWRVDMEENKRRIQEAEAAEARAHEEAQKAAQEEAANTVPLISPVQDHMDDLPEDDMFEDGGFETLT